ncbi:hypothetical protein L1049_022750 [Liquidambar formosana]|uniref:Uncharacterized protein n=1 Tax=Liquidambar formosana TaxID=63359 RepID=A0AAP0WRM9_LIQFO
MHVFALSLLRERQGEEQRQRIKAEYLLKDFEKRLRTFHMERGKMEHDMLSNKAKRGVSPLNNLKVDLDSMRKRQEEERSRHKDVVKLVHDAASSSIQAGLIPIFEAMGNFTSNVLKYHEQVRFENDRGS